MGTSRGLDVSSYQGVQDWPALAKSGVVFAFAKASEGEHTKDAHFAMHIEAIINIGLVPGAYHFAWPNQPAEVEAANYIGAVKSHARRGFVHVLDLERRSDGANYKGRTAAQIRAYASAWIAAVAQAFPGQRVGVYTSADDIAAKHVPANAGFLWYPAYPLGYTAMSYAQAEARARPAPSGQRPLFWQFTSTPLDRNLAYLSPADLRAWADGGDDDGEQTDHQEDDVSAMDVLTYRNAKADAASVKAGHGHIPDFYGYVVQTNGKVNSLVGTVNALVASNKQLLALLTAKAPDASTAAALNNVADSLDKVAAATAAAHQDGGADDGE